ncbi:MAG: hypothetical protein JSR29_07545 [Nitrospira sp.]|nr:hypothetical protein [Nitrospira sp.]
MHYGHRSHAQLVSQYLCFCKDYWLVYDQRINEKWVNDRLNKWTDASKDDAKVFTPYYEYIGYLQSIQQDTEAVTQEDLQHAAKCLAKEYGKLEFTNDPDCTAKGSNKFPNLANALHYNKPIATKRDNARVLVLGQNPLVCKLTENAFTATDAAIVPPTSPRQEKKPASISAEGNGLELSPPAQSPHRTQ